MNTFENQPASPIDPCGDKKIDLGCGRVKRLGFIGIDKEQFIDGEGNPRVDIVRDFEAHGLPFCDNAAELIVANSVLEHIHDLEFVLNECHRVLRPGGILEGMVPYAGTDGSFRDPTHCRFFTLSTFDYFCGESLADPALPYKPKYARYGFLPWTRIEIVRPENNGTIIFKMTPKK